MEPETLSFERTGSAHDIETGDTFQPRFTNDGLLPAIVTSHSTKHVLMFAWMNADALTETLKTGTACFWSRSRAKLWRKGEESGNTLTVRRISADCDQDVIWVEVDVNGAGVTCHTGAVSCFYREIDLDSVGTGHAKLTRRD